MTENRLDPLFQKLFNDIFNPPRSVPSIELDEEKEGCPHCGAIVVPDYRLAGKICPECGKVMTAANEDAGRDDHLHIELAEDIHAIATDRFMR